MCLLLLLTAVSLWACELDGECSHSFDSWQITKEADCAGPGSQSRHCQKCGYIQTEEIRASVAHKEESLPAVAATCTESGLTEGKRCTVCYQELLSQQVVPATGHSEVADAAVAATCTEAGLSEGKHCGVCDVVIQAQEPVEALGHTAVVDEAVAPTCMDTGLTEGSHCGICGLVLTAQETVAATGHSYETTPLEKPTCTTEGSMECVCSHCGDTYSVPVSLPSFNATQIHDMAKVSVGEVLTYDANGNQLSLGSCFVYSSDGKIVTNYHVIKGAVRAVVTINETTYEVKQVLGYSPELDLAVLKIDAKGLKALPICSATHAVGENVYAFGSSQGLSATFSQGIITHALREVGGVLCVQHDAAISSGNSGGPLINRFGEVIGVNTFYISDSQNLNFAVSVGELAKLDMSKPMTLADVYKAERSPFEILRDYLMVYGTYLEDEKEYTVVLESVFSDDGDEFITFYDYDAAYNQLEFNLTMNWEVQVIIYIDEEYGVYGWKYVDVYGDTMYGYQGAADFKEGVALRYDEYELNDLDSPDALAEYAYNFVDLLLGWLDYDLEGLNLTAEDFGFIHY